MDRNLALEFVRVTEAAAIAAAGWVGMGDKNAADGAAVDAMRERFNKIDFSGTVVIGEGSKDEAPELYNGEKVGTGSGPEIDLAIDPLECTNSVAFGRYNAMSVVVAGSKDSLLNAPDTYMQKLAGGPEVAGVLNLDDTVEQIIKKCAEALGKPKSEITVVVLDRERQQPLIDEIRSAGARVRLITDGDVAGALSTCFPESGIDLLMGTGGSTEGVLAAAAIKILGGQILTRFNPINDKEKQKLLDHGITDHSKIMSAEDLATGNQMTFTATGIIDGPLLSGVVFQKNKAITHSLVIRAQSGTVRYITTHHKIN